VVNDEFNLVHVQVGPAESPRLVPECGIAALGAGLLALPLLQLTGINYEVTRVREQPADELGSSLEAQLLGWSRVGERRFGLLQHPGQRDGEREKRSARFHPERWRIGRSGG
jgi:hypothetical protein